MMGRATTLGGAFLAGLLLGFNLTTVTRVSLQPTRAECPKCPERAKCPMGSAVAESQAPLLASGKELVQTTPATRAAASAYRTTSNLGSYLQSLEETSTFQAYIQQQQSKLNDQKNLEKVGMIDIGRQHQVTRQFSAVAAQGTGGVSGGFQGKTVLCLGARLGGEVRAFKSLGAIAVGVDLNPGAANLDVLYGDFHNIAFLDSSFSFAYTNVLDHVFDIERFSKELCRVVAPGGYFFATIYPGRDEWSAAGGIFADNKDKFYAVMRNHNFEYVTETMIKEDMHLGKYNTWHEEINTLFFLRNQGTCSLS